MTLAEEKTSGISRSTWRDDNNKTYLNDIAWNYGLNWTVTAYRPGIGSYGHSSEPPGSLKKSVLDQQNNYRLLKDENPPCNYSMSDNNTSPLIHVVDKLTNKPRQNYTLKSLWKNYFSSIFVSWALRSINWSSAWCRFSGLVYSNLTCQLTTTITATYPKPASLTIPSFVAYQRLQVRKAIKQSAPCKRPQNNISVPLIFTASGKKITKEFISNLTPKASLIESF